MGSHHWSNQFLIKAHLGDLHAVPVFNLKKTKLSDPLHNNMFEADGVTGCSGAVRRDGRQWILCPYTRSNVCCVTSGKSLGGGALVSYPQNQENAICLLYCGEDEVTSGG